jgi:hypothetical protein
VYSSAVFNFIPKTAIEFYNAHAAGDTKTTNRLIDDFFLPYITIRNKGQGYAVSIVKAGATVVGHGAGPVRPPLSELKASEVEELRALIAKLGPANGSRARQNARTGVGASVEGGRSMEVKGAPLVTDLRVVPVAGEDSMLMNLSGAHGPYFTRNVVILKDASGHVGVGEVPGGEKIRQTLEDARPLVVGQPIGRHNAILTRCANASPIAMPAAAGNRRSTCARRSMP